MSEVTPALVLAARRGFVYRYVGVGGGTFQDDSHVMAECMFDDRAEAGHWSEKFYRDWAEEDPWRRDEDTND